MPLLQGPHRCQLCTSQTFRKAELNSGCINHPQPFQRSKFPNLRVASRSAGGACPVLQAAGQAACAAGFPQRQQSPSHPSFALHWASLETCRRINGLCFYKGIASFSGSQHKGRSVPMRAGVCVCARRQTRMRARTQAHGKNYLGVRNLITLLLPVLD